MKIFTLTLSILISTIGFSQLVTNIQDIKVDVDFDNVYVKKLDTDSNSTSFIIWIKNGVKSHKHLEHSEVIYVIEGEGMMTVNESKFYIGPGDYFRIPKNTYHRSTSGEEGSIVINQAKRYAGFQASEEFIPISCAEQHWLYKILMNEKPVIHTLGE